MFTVTMQYHFISLKDGQKKKMGSNYHGLKVEFFCFVVRNLELVSPRQVLLLQDVIQTQTHFSLLFCHSQQGFFSLIIARWMLLLQIAHPYFKQEEEKKTSEQIAKWHLYKVFPEGLLSLFRFYVIAQTSSYGHPSCKATQNLKFLGTLLPRTNLGFFQEGTGEVGWNLLLPFTSMDTH